jgi:hypothetical protein
MRRFVHSKAAVVGVVLAGALALTGCGGGGGGGTTNNPPPPPPPTQYSIGVKVSGLVGTGLKLHSGLGDLDVTANGDFTLGKVDDGTDYEVTVSQQPSSPTQICTVADGKGTVQGADVVATVTCATNSYSIGGTVSGLVGTGLVLHSNLGDDLSITGNGAFVFPTKAATGTHYKVTVGTSPSSPSQACTIDHPEGDMGEADVALSVTCTTNAFTVGGTVSDLDDATDRSGLVLLNNGGDNLTVDANGAFHFATPIASGAQYQVTIKTLPTPFKSCRVASGGSGTVAGGNVTSVQVTCSSTVVQRWAAPTTWGSLWKDDGHLVQHAHFQSDGSVVEEKSVTWSVQSGPLPAPKELDAFPAGPRYGAGFAKSGGGSARLQASAGEPSLTGDMLVCAIVKPDYDPITNGQEKVFIADGIQGTAGWALTQTGTSFGFGYQYTANGGGSQSALATTPTRFAGATDLNTATSYGPPLNPSYLVVCGGRNGSQIVVAANGYVCANELAGEEGTCSFRTATLTGTQPFALDAGSHHLTIGGYDNGSSVNAFPGRVYETAIWNEAATPQNVQAKLSEAQGLLLNESEQGVAVTYTRNREGPFIGIDSKYHTTWKSGPRFDTTKGLLFGLQGWNRVSRCQDDFGNIIECQTDLTKLIAYGEALDLWTKNGGAQVQANQIEPPGDSEKAAADLVTLPSSGASITTPLAAFDAAGLGAAGPVLGQIWLRVPTGASGTLRVRTSNPQALTDRLDINLATQLTPDTWTRFSLSALTTDGSEGNLILEAPSGAVSPFYAWGIDLTQMAGGSNLGSFDPGPAMYDWLGNILDGRFPLDVLQLPTVPASTAANGFCLSADAQPADGLSWTAPFAADRALVTWLDATGNGVNLFVAGGSGANAGKLCTQVQNGASSSALTCGALPSFAAGSKHTIAMCAQDAADHVTYAITLYADGSVVGTPDTGESKASQPDLANGHILVGNDGFNTNPGAGGPGGNSLATWQGYISKVVVCHADAIANCQ